MGMNDNNTELIAQAQTEPKTVPAEKYDELRRKNDALSRSNAKLVDTIAMQSNTINNLSNDIAQIKASTSWRVTAPLRALSNFFKIIIKSFIFFRRNGLKKTIKRILNGGNRVRYISDTIDRYNTISQELREEQENHKFSKKIKFSVIVPVYNTPKAFLREMLNSVVDQTYPNWELCIADGSDDKHSNVKRIISEYAKKDSRIHYKKLTQNLGISDNTNLCLEMATGDYIALFDHDDMLHPCALYEYMRVICDKKADFIYCDEDKFTELGKGFYDPHFKPDFAPDNLRSNNYICHMTVFKKELLDQVGGFRRAFDGSQDHDMILRLTEKAKNIVHIPMVLYHWRASDASVASDPYAKPYTIQAGINAVSEHIERMGLKGTVESSPIHPNIYRVRYEIKDNPLISILIPNYNHVEELSVCIDSILEKSTYDNYEIIIIENNSDEETFKYYETLKYNPKIKIVTYKSDSGFNYSAINNFGEKYASGDYLLLLNNDIEVITHNWMEEMLMFCQRDDVGAVGAKLYYPDDTIQHAGVILGVLDLAGHAFRNAPRDYAGYFGRASYQQDLTACTAACLMVKRSVFKEIGGFDEKLEVAFNDIDLCMKIRSKDYLIVFTPYAELYHYESKSRGVEDTPEKLARFIGEVERFKEKWHFELEAGDPYYNPNLTLKSEDFSEKEKPAEGW